MAGSGIRKYLRAAGLDPATGPTDAELVAQFAEGRDEAAFELLVFRHAPLVQRACRAVLNDHHAAEDAAQATFLALARKAHTLSGRGTVVGWLYRVARRVAVRAAKRRVPVAVAELGDAPARAAVAELETDTAAAVCAEVDRLPERYRVPVLLCFFEGLTHAEAARRAGVPVGTVAGRLARAKDLLAKRLSRRGVALATVALPTVAGSFAGSTARAACEFAAGRSVENLVSETVLSLAQGALKPMVPNFLKATAAAVAVACATAAGVWGFSGPANPGANPAAPPAPPALAQPVAADAKLPDADAAQRRLSMNNLKQILLAIHNYHDAYGHLPRDITDKNGKPLLSWRVTLLPYIEQDAMFREFKLDEPWDSATNKKLLNKMPRVYSTTNERGASKTYYQVFSGPGTAFEPGKKVGLATIPDGTSNTIGVIEGGPAVEWTKPADINYDPKKAFPRPTGPFGNTYMVGMLDGAAFALKPDLKDDVFSNLVEVADGTVLPNDLKAAFPAATKEEKKLAGKVLAQNEALVKEFAALLAERGRLLGELVAQSKPGADLDRLLIEQEQIKNHIEELKGHIEDLRRQLKGEVKPPPVPQKPTAPALPLKPTEEAKRP